MLFNSIHFIIFLLIVVSLYYICPKKYRWVELLIASYYFYMSWNVKYVLILVSYTVISYLAAICIEKIDSKDSDNHKKTILKRTVLFAGIAIVAGILIYYKYTDYFLMEIGNITRKFGIFIEQPERDIILPIGISFITFQTIGYIVDVYRKQISAERNIFRYALFVAFFPHLVSGPIERAKDLIPQIKELKNKPNVSYDKMIQALILILYGYMMKVVVSDKLSILVASIFSEPDKFNSTILIVGAIAFSMQIYCDFAGYSNIAVGIGRIFGIDIIQNFDAPYFSTGIREFWRRWHISLSSWLRDYIYIPLGGNRKGQLLQYINIMITFLISGLWHGAAGKFVLWGAIHGIYQIIESLIDKLLGKKNHSLEDVNPFVRTILTFMFVTLAWIFFRADTKEVAILYIGGIFSIPNVKFLFDGSLYNLGLDHNSFAVALAGVIIILIFDLIKYRKKQDVETLIYEKSTPVRWTLILLLIASIVIFGEYGLGYNAKEFIYLQF